MRPTDFRLRSLSLGAGAIIALGLPAAQAQSLHVSSNSQVSVADERHSLDSALLMTLVPGAYTAEVSGSSGDSGIALVEIYAVR